MNEKQVSKSIRINFKPQEQESIMFLMKQFAKDSEHDLIRFLISRTYTEQKELELKYAKGNSSIQMRRQKLDETLSNIKAMSPEELQAYLLEIGYFKEDHKEETDSLMPSDTILRDRIYEITTTNGERDVKYVQERYSEKDKKINYAKDVYMSIDEIIRDLMREKLI